MYHGILHCQSKPYTITMTLPSALLWWTMLMPCQTHAQSINQSSIFSISPNNQSASNPVVVLSITIVITFVTPILSIGNSWRGEFWLNPSIHKSCPKSVVDKVMGIVWWWIVKIYPWEIVALSPWLPSRHGWWACLLVLNLKRKAIV